MPFYKDGVFHLYYLLDVNHHNHPIVDYLGGHVYAHAVSTDLIHWEHKPIALPLDFDKGECSNCTGSILEYNGRVYAFVSQRLRHVPGEHFRIFVSDDDGTSFHPWEHTPQLEPPEDCNGAFRDPMAFIGDDGVIHVLMTSGISHIADDGTSVRAGCLAHYSTKDMIHYEKHDPLLQTLFMPECADYFEWNGKYYYSVCRFWQTEFHYADAPFGPWKRMEQCVPASRFCAVMKTAPWKDGRRIGAGWVPSFVNGQHDFGGRIVFRELIRKSDGTLGSAFVEEMLPDELICEPAGVTAENADGAAQQCIGIFDGNIRMDGTIRFTPGTERFGFIIRDRKQVYRVPATFEVEDRQVDFNGATRITKVEMGEEIRFRFVRTNDVFDLEINGERTIVTSYIDFMDTFVSFFVENGRIEVTDLKIYR